MQIVTNEKTLNEILGCKGPLRDLKFKKEPLGFFSFKHFNEQERDKIITDEAKKEGYVVVYKEYRPALGGFKYTGFKR